MHGADIGGGIRDMSKYEQMISGIRSEYGAHFLMDFMPAGFFRCSMDAVRKVDMANRTMLDLFGCRDTAEFEDLTGGTLEGMILDKDYEHAIMESRNQLCQGKDILKTEFRIVRKDKSTRWVDCRGRIIEGEKGQRWVYTIMLDDTEDKKQIHTYREKSRRDSLTGLLNREASKEQITQYLEAVGTEGTAALMIIDIDNFKDINDTKGHLFGDSVLTEVAKCISGVSRRSDVVSRIGGDEFLVFLIGVSGQEEVMAYGGRIMEAWPASPPRRRNPSASNAASVWPCIRSMQRNLTSSLPRRTLRFIRERKAGRGNVSFISPHCPPWMLPGGSPFPPGSQGLIPRTSGSTAGTGSSTMYLRPCMNQGIPGKRSTPYLRSWEFSLM